jgi:hypothetical protein
MVNRVTNWLGVGKSGLKERLKRRRLGLQPSRLFGASEPLVFGCGRLAINDFRTHNRNDILCRQFPTRDFSGTDTESGLRNHSFGWYRFL